jgi:hypothetical protein
LTHGTYSEIPVLSSSLYSLVWPPPLELVAGERVYRGGRRKGEIAMTSIQPELWVDAPSEAVTFYEAAFGANVLHRVGEGDDIVAQLAVGDAAFWVAGTSRL